MMESMALTPSSGQSFLGLCVPGGPVRTDFVPTTQTKLTLTLNAPGDLPVPISSVSDVVCFLLPGAPIPPTHGLLVYWQVVAPGFSTGFELLGSLTPTRPSGVFRTNWSQHEEICNQVGASGARVVLGVSMETLEEIANVASHESYDARLFMAQKIATDLFHYMQSFDNGSAGVGKLVVPTTIFDRWMERFKSRFRRDPNFFMKSQD